MLNIKLKNVLLVIIILINICVNLSVFSAEGDNGIYSFYDAVDLNLAPPALPTCTFGQWTGGYVANNAQMSTFTPFAAKRTASPINGAWVPIANSFDASNASTYGMVCLVKDTTLKETKVLTGPAYAPVIKWTAPKTGYIKLTSKSNPRLDNANAGGNGVNFAIYKNEKVNKLWGYALTNKSEFLTGISYDTTISVTAGDNIYFYTDCNGIASYDTVIWTPVVEYVTEILDFSYPTLIASDMVIQRNKPIPIFGDSKGEQTITVRMQGDGVDNTATVVPVNNKWKVELPQLAAGGPYTITISNSQKTKILTNVMVGDIWIVSGQSNAQWPISAIDNPTLEKADMANYPGIRLFRQTVGVSKEPILNTTATWQTLTDGSVSAFSAVGYIFAKEVYRETGVPIGLMQAASGGSNAAAWTSKAVLESDPSWSSYLNWDGITDDTKKGTGHYNYMLAPLMQVPVSGMLWYQGEADSDAPARYYKMLRTIIPAWREGFNNQTMPVLIVQLPKYAGATPNAGDGWAKFRECQEKIWLNTPNTGLAVTIDTGLEVSIHPTEKRPVGERLAKYALGSVYNRDIVYKSPVYKSKKLSSNKLVLEFDNVGTGLITSDGGNAVLGFEISADGTNFVPATAKIIATNKIEVSADGITTPKDARYAWENYYLQENIRNSGNLPAGSFRTNFSEDYVLNGAPGSQVLNPIPDIVYQNANITNVLVTYQDNTMTISGRVSRSLSTPIGLFVKDKDVISQFDYKYADDENIFEFTYPLYLSSVAVDKKELTIVVDNIEVADPYISEMTIFNNEYITYIVDKLKTASNVVQNIKDEEKGFEFCGVMMDKFNSLTNNPLIAQQIINLINQKRLTFTNKNIGMQINGIMVIVEANNSNSSTDIDRILKEYDTHSFDLTINKEQYANMNSATRTFIAQNILDRINSQVYNIASELANDVLSLYALDQINSATYVKMIDDIKKYKDNLNLTTISEYATFVNYNINTEYEVTKILVKSLAQTGKYITTDRFVSDFISAVKIVANSLEEKASQDVGNSTSGGKAFGGIMVVEDKINNQNSIAFNDLIGVDWAVESINSLNQLGIVKGKNLTQFAPNDILTREEFLTMLIRAFNLLDNNAECNFADVDKNAWYYSYIATAKEKGLVNGVSESDFGVGNGITRQEMSVMVNNVSKFVNLTFNQNNKIDFTDYNNIATWAKQAVDTLSSSGVINGIGNNKFDPTGMSTRAQAAKIIYTILKMKGEVSSFVQ
jgi:sialate O-acetylesterase